MKITDLPNYSVVSPRNKVTSEATQQSDSPFLQQLGTGAAKELGSTAIGLGTIGRKIQTGISKGVDKLFGTKGFGLSDESVFDEGSQKQLNAKEFLTPEGGAEKLGSFVTEAASFAIPGSKVTKATKGANFLTRTSGLVASDVGVTAVQQGGFDKESVDAAIIAAAFPIAGKGGQTLKKTLPSGKDAGGKVINSLIKPLLKDFSYGKNPGQAVADAGITANSLDELAVNIRKVRQATGNEISEKVANHKGVFDVSDSMSAIDDAIEEASKSPRTNAAIIGRLENLKADLLKVDDAGEATRVLNNLSAQDVFDLKREVGDLTRWTGNASDDEIVNKALKVTYGKLKGQLDDNVEGISELTGKYADLKSAEIATEYRDKIAARQNLISFSGTQLGTVAAVTSAIVSGGAVMPILVGAGAGIGTEALKSPAVKTRAAAWLASAPKEEIAEAFVQAPWLRGALQASLFGEEEEISGTTD